MENNVTEIKAKTKDQQYTEACAVLGDKEFRLEVLKAEITQVKQDILKIAQESQ